MKLRPRQEIFVDKCVNALVKHGNTLGVAVVGFGKSYSLSIVIDKMIKNHNAKKVIVLQHRTELKEQNRDKFNIATENNYTTSFVQGAKKDFSKQVVFGMIQTVGRNLNTLPAFDLCVIDETHRVMSKQYLEVIKKLKELNPNVKLLGVTATPNRGDGKGLGKVFSNVADVVSIEETIRAGNLVPPRTYSIDMGQIADLMNVRKIAGEYDQEEVAEALGGVEITAGIIKHWKELAFTRKTIAFCPTVDYAIKLQAHFEQAGIETALVHGGLSKKNRKIEINSYENGTAKIMFNVAVFTEGYDYPPTSCILLMRQSSYQGTMVQMIGRGLRTVNENEYPEHKNKSDCIVLDFGLSTSLHGSLEDKVNLEDRKKEELEVEEKQCPECYGFIPIRSKICPLCGFKEEKKLQIIKEELKLPVDFNLVEVNLIDKCAFRYESFYNDKLWIVKGFEAQAWVCKLKDGSWNTLAKKQREEIRLLKKGDRKECFNVANKWMAENEPDKSAGKKKRWLNEPMTARQNQALEIKDPFHKGRYSMPKYRAMTRLSFMHFADKIKEVIAKGEVYGETIRENQ